MEQPVIVIRQEYFQTKSHALAAGIVLGLLDIMAVALRFLARQQQRQKLKAEDWLMLPALAFTVGLAVILVYGVSQEALAVPMKIPEGFVGNPLEIVTYQITTMMKLQTSFYTILPLALGCAKASFICLFIRIFSVNKKSGTNILLVGMLVFVIVWSVTFFFATLFQCGTSFWVFSGSSMDLATECPNTMMLDIAVCASDLAVDLAIFFIPIPLIWRLNLNRTKKVAVCVVFLLGGVTIVASLLRLIMMVRIFTVGFDPNEDGVLVVTGYLYWGMVECGVAVFAACLPTLQSLLRKKSWHTIVTFVRGYTTSRSSDATDDVPPGVHIDATTTVASEKVESDRLRNGNRAHVQNYGEETFFDSTITGSTLNRP